MEIRQPKIKLFINDKDATRDISDFILEVVYTDSIEEKAKDELQITLENDKRRFLKDWAIQTNSKVEAWIIYNDKDGSLKEFTLGTFYVGDDFTCRAKGSILTVKATSQSLEDLDNFKKIRNEGYENIYLNDLVQQIINKCSKKSIVDTPDVFIERIDIANQSYEQFLKQLAKKYNCRFFIRSGVVVFSNKLQTQELDLTNYLIDDQIRFKAKKEAVKAVEMLYYKPNSKQAQLYREEVPDVKEGKTVRIQDIAHNLQEAKEKVKAYIQRIKTDLRAEGTFTIYGQPVNAGDKVIIPEDRYGFLGGIYESQKVIHSIKKDEGWKTNITIKYIGG